MRKPVFYKSVLVEVEGNILDDVYPHLLNTIHMPTMEERLGDAECPNCIEEIRVYDHKKLEDRTRWVLLPKESASVIQGGKPYIECLDCGYKTHL